MGGGAGVVRGAGPVSVICLAGRFPDGWEDVLLARVPRVAVESAEGAPTHAVLAVEGARRVWADGRGLRAEEVARAVVRRLAGRGGEVRGGVAAVPVAAWAAAVGTGAGDVAIVRAGADRSFLGPLPLTVLELDERVCGLLEGAGVETCGALAALPAEAVEVRFGATARTAWRRARGEDERRLFRRTPPTPPHAAMDFVDYVVTDPERLVFAANALLGPLCEGMSARGSHARHLGIALPLANGEVWRRVLKAARPTASRTTWLRLLRGVLERLTVPDAVTGIELQVQATEPAAAIQGDLFDAGFGTAAGAESALVRLLETQGDVIVRAAADAHPVPERRAGAFEADDAVLSHVHAPAAPRPRPGRRSTRSAVPAVDAAPGLWGRIDASGLTLQLLPEPRPVQVEVLDRRDHVVPVRYRDGRWRTLVTAAGPERLSGGQWEEAYAREYYRCVTGDGLLVWLFHDAPADRWYLQGWWD